jgi:hypothetical protein
MPHSIIRKGQIYALLSVFFCLSVATAKADSVTVTFDDIPTGTSSSNRYFPNGLQLLTLVTRSSSGEILGVGGSFNVITSPGANTGQNIAVASGFNGSNNYYFGDANSRNLYGFFVSPINADERVPVSNLSFFVVGTMPGQDQSWRVEIISTTGFVLDTISGFVDRQVVFSREFPDIAGFRFFASSNIEGIDTISFGSAAKPVPEPATFILLGTGLAAVAGAVRRRRVAKEKDAPMNRL